MPIYEYACKPCDQHKELIVGSVHEPPSCVSCGEVMVRQISLSSFRIFGQGVYRPNQR
jgi:putative FmdB family regulatory protein